MNKVAVITGALKGLGLETAKGLLNKKYQVVISGRDQVRGLEVEADLAKFGSVKFIQLDVADVASIEAFTKDVLADFGSIDVLVNNAGIFPDREKAASLEDLSEDLHKAFRTNSVGPMLMIEKVLPGMLAKGSGRIVNVSSGMGQLSHMGGGSPAYRVSKVALNGVTKFYYATLRNTDVLINSVCPGWVKTDMGGSQAPRSLEKGVSGIIWAATLPKGGPNGGFFRDGEPLEF